MLFSLRGYLRGSVLCLSFSQPQLSIRGMRMEEYENHLRSFQNTFALSPSQLIQLEMLIQNVGGLAHISQEIFLCDSNRSPSSPPHIPKQPLLLASCQYRTSIKITKSIFCPLGLTNMPLLRLQQHAVRYGLSPEGCNTVDKRNSQ